MKRKLLEKLSNGDYYINDNCTYKKGVGKLCTFWIRELVVYETLGKARSFEITLDGNNETKTKLFPISYLNDPLSWLYFGFDMEDFRITTTKKEFESSMVKIIDLFIQNKKHETSKDYIGWKFEQTQIGPLNEQTLYFFEKFEEPGEILDFKKGDKPANFLFEYIKLADISVSAPLLSYMLLSLLTSLLISGTNVRTDFNVALVGGSAELRRRYALFFANVYRRDPTFCKNEYEVFHINRKDSSADIRIKAAAVKDCVLIAFEPDTIHLKTLLDKIYNTNVIDEDRPFANLLLFTREHTEKKAIRNTLVISLNDGDNTKAIEDYFKISSANMIEDYSPTFSFSSYEDIQEEFLINPPEDYLMESIYYYINWLTENLIKNKRFVREKFIEHREEFEIKLQLRDIPQSTSISQVAQDVAQQLSFAFSLYAECFNAQEDILCDDVYNSILNAAKNSFPAEGAATEEDFEKAKAICKQIDKYFESKTNHDLIGIIGGEKLGFEKRVWCDDETIYIRRKNLIEFLILTGSKMRYNKNINIALADKNLIETITKNDGKPEYSVHIQKRLYEEDEIKEKKNSGDQNKSEEEKKKERTKNKTPYRFMAFNRERCRQHNLFENIEKIITNRCQIDVKTTEKEEKN